MHIVTNRKSMMDSMFCLSLATQLERVAAYPGSAARASLGLRESVTLAETTRAASSRGKTTHLTVLMNSVYDPVDLGVTADSLKTSSRSTWL